MRELITKTLLTLAVLAAIIIFVAGFATAAAVLPWILEDLF